MANTFSNLDEGMKLLLPDAGSSNDPPRSKKLRVDESQFISQKITEFSISEGVATKDSGISLSFNPDGDDLEKYYGDRAIPAPSPDNLGAALLRGVGTKFSPGDQLEWNYGGEDPDYATSEEQDNSP